ncbi:MAG: TonB-dependent receptor [Bacteroidales bacterium]
MLFFFGLATTLNGFSQVTTSGVNGKVVGPDGETLPGATVVAVHIPTSSLYGATTDANGFYRLPNMDIGGPYTIRVSYLGYEAWSRENVFLTLGQTAKVDVQLKTTEVRLGEIAVIGRRGSVNVFDGNRTGAQTVIPLERIEMMPTVGRDLTDFTRLTPQASVDDNQAINIAGINNRYNSLMIDGGAQNDLFGLAASGVNGGQTGGTPISMDAIEQFQISIAPYDVRNSGFAGAAMNAVTRRGTNEVSGSVYGFLRNEKLSGKTPLATLDTKDKTKEEIAEMRKPLADFTAITSGFRVGGPIIKNKLFFFINGEVQRDQTPAPFEFSRYNGNASEADLNALAEYLKNQYGYDPGSFIDNAKLLNSNKLLARLDWNINDVHKLMLRHSYTDHKSYSPGTSSSSTINFGNSGIYFPSRTNSTTLELKSNFSKMSNSLMVVYSDVNDDRDPMGMDFPAVNIRDGSGAINFGSEQFSTGNELIQKSITLTDNLSIYKGKHTITLGTSNEFAHVYNLFVRQNYGYYQYNSLADFYKNKAFNYTRYYSLVDDITGDGSLAAANFNMLQLGLYAQDEFRATDDFKLTFGIRADMPIFLTPPVENTKFNEETIPLLEAAGWDLMGAKAGQMPKPQVMISPRVGFNWDLSGDETAQLRGGVGIFTSRLPRDRQDDEQDRRVPVHHAVVQ